MTSLSNQRCTRNQRLFLLTLVGWIALAARPVQGNDDAYYAAGDDGNANDDNYYSNYYSNNNNGGDDAYAGDDANANANANTDDANNNNADGDDANNQYSNNDDANGDDANADNGDDANANDNNNGNGDDEYAQMNNQYYDSSNGNDASYGQYQDDWAENNANVVDDDLFHWENNVGFDGVSVMPVSCVNYNNGHMIKFEFFESETSYQCHFAQIGTFVVSIAHYMRAYFNHQALVHGQDFELPGDAGYLNCIMVQETEYSNEPLYAKIGCMERETFTSTKLALHLYTDDICSVPFDDGFTSRRHSAKGFEVNGHTVSSHVSFRPPFYTCQTCKPEEYSETFNKRAGTWYDDDYISEHGEANNEGDDQVEEEEEEENAQNDDNGDNGQYQDDYFADDAYLAANDDINYNNRMLLELEEEATSKALVRVEQPAARKLTPVEGQLEAFEKEFWDSVEERKRSLYDNAYDIDDWNMCQRVYTYGLWCDEDCRSLDAFRTDRWSGADIILLSIMATFLTAMMLLILAKRLKAAQKSRMYSQEDTAMPGLPPVAMMSIFLGIMTVIVIMAKFKFVNETLVFAVVTCLLLFIYMLKLTLFDNRRPVLLAATRHDVFDNPMDQRLFT